LTANASSGNSNTLLASIKTSLSRGQFQQALHECDQLIESEPASTVYSEAQYFRAVACRYCKDFQQAKQSIDALLSVQPDNARGLQELGYIKLASGEPIQAIKAFYGATLNNPALVSSWRQLAELYQQAPQTPQSAIQQANENLSFWSSLPKQVIGAADLMFSDDIVTADQVCRGFLQQQKHHPDAMYVLALIDIKQNAYDEAELLLDSCLLLVPEHRRARAEYAALLNRTGKFELALQQAEKLLAEKTKDTSASVLQAVAKVGLGELNTGIQIFLEILKQEPHRASIWLQLGHAHKSLGQIQQAIDAYKQAVTHREHYGDAYWSLANTKSYRFGDDEIEKMERVLATQPLSHDDRTHMQFALAKGLDDAGKHTAAFDVYQQANSEKFAISDYRADHVRRQIEDQIAFFSEAFFAKRASFGHSDRAPIFIVGLPRSGSTLLEQILSAHSQVDATQELQFVLSVAKRLRQQGDYPNQLEDISNSTFTEFGEQFIRDTQAYRQQAAFFIDKMPNNFLHVGLIKLMLPNAKIIDARRDPMDCCFSCYKQLFAEGQDFTYDLTALGSFYTDYVRLMEHWEKVLPGFVLRVQHEDILNDLEQQTRRMLDFCGLEFEPQCLEFYNNQRAVQTPSSAQVRRPINRDGVGRWEAVSDELTELRKALEPILAR
jgi:tetratricopeptide (TPR) repeat protein